MQESGWHQVPISLMIKSAPFSLHASKGGAVFYKAVIVAIESINVQEVWTSLKNEVVYCKVVSTNISCLDCFRLVKYKGKMWCLFR